MCNKLNTLFPGYMGQYIVVDISFQDKIAIMCWNDSLYMYTTFITVNTVKS